MHESIIRAIQNAQETHLVGVLEFIFGILPEPSPALSPAELKVLADLERRAFVLPAKDGQHVIALIGLTGDGKSHIAEKLARQYDATLISSDAIRVLLHKEGCAYKHVDAIVRRLMFRILLQGGSVVLDSDHVPPNKRGLLNSTLREFGITPEYVRVLADPQDALRWIHEGKYDGTIYDPKIVSPEHKPGGWRLKMLERERHYAWHYLRNGTPRRFMFPHTEVRNRGTK